MDLFKQINYVLSYPKNDVKLESILYDECEVKSLNNYMLFKWLGFHNDECNILSMNIVNKYVFSRAFYKNYYLFVLMCKLTNNNVNSRINYIKNKKDNKKYPDELISIFKKVHGEFLKINAVNDIIDLIRNKYVQEFAKMCILSGMKYKDIIKNFPELKDLINDEKIDAKERKKIFISLNDDVVDKEVNKKNKKRNNINNDIL